VQFIEEGTKLVTSGAEDGAIIIWRVNYDLEEPADPTVYQSIVKPKSADDEEEEVAPPEEEEEEPEEEEEEEEEEFDEDGNPKPKMPVVYDSGDEEDLFDGLRMKTHLTLRKSHDSANQGQKKGSSSNHKYSAILPWAPSVGLENAAAIESVESETAASSVTPTDELKLHWVYGYSSRIPRAAVKYSTEGQIVYPAGGIGITYDKLGRKQVHAMTHCDEITCLDVHTGANVAATAHKGAGNIFACIWVPSTGHILRRLNCGAANGASAIAFSPNGKLLAVALQNESHDILLFDWSNNLIRARVAGGFKKVLTLAFSLAPAPPMNADGGAAVTSPFPSSSLPPAVPEIPIRILQAGVNHFQLLELKVGRTFSVKAGYLGPDLKKVNVLCSAALPVPSEEGGNEFVLGLSNGSIGIIGRGEKSLSNVIPVQKGAITALCVVRLKKDDGTPAVEGAAAGAEGDDDQLFKLVTGGVNGFIKVLDQNFEPIAEFNLYRVPELYGNLHQVGRVRGIKSLCVDKAHRKIVWGTSGGEIGEIELDTGKDVNDGPLVRSHFRDQLCALAPHPIRQECLTAGDDKTLRIWNLESASQSTSIDLPDIARCGCYSPNGHLIAVGLGGDVPGINRQRPRPYNGQIVVLSYLQGILNIVYRTTDAADTVTSVTFTLDGSKLLVASLDAAIYVYDALDNFKLVNTLKKHTEGILSLDISSDGRYLASMSSQSEVIVWDLMLWLPVPEKDQIECLKTSTWAIRQGTFGRDSVGAFPMYGTAEEVLTVTKSHDNSLLISGDCSGLMYMRTYPSICPGAPAKVYQGHTAGGVAKVVFSIDDKFVLSVGRDDRTMMQWEVVRSARKPDAPSPAVDSDSTAASASSLLAAASKPPGAVGGDDGSTFDSSFEINGVKFTVPAKSQAKIIASATSHVPTVTLTEILGVGNSAGSYRASHANSGSDNSGGSGGGVYTSLTLPVAQYSGSGEILTVHGRTLTAISGGDHVAQRHWHITDGHTEEIGVITVSACSRYVLISRTHGRTSAERTYSLGVYNAASGALECELSNDLPGEVSAVAFASDGHTAACLCRDRHHSLCLYTTSNGHWQDTIVLYTGPISEADISVLSFLNLSNRPPYTSFSGHVHPPLPPLPPLSDEPTSPAKHPHGRGAGKSSPKKPAKKDAPTVEVAIKEPDAGSSTAEGKVGEDSTTPTATAAVETTAVEAEAETFDLVTGGAGHLRFWRIYGRNVVSACADYMNSEGQGPHPTITAASSLPGCPHAITGDVTGGIWLWVGKTRGQCIGTHSGPVTALRGFTSAWGTGVATAATDSLRLWVMTTTGAASDSRADGADAGVETSNDSAVATSTSTVANFVCVREFQVSSLLSAVGLHRITPKNVLPSVTSLATDSLCNRLLFTLSTSAIVEVSVDSGSAIVLAEGLSHRLSAFATHPTETHTIVTADQDNLLKIWDISPASRGVTAVVPLPRFASALAFQNAHILAVAVAGADAHLSHGGNPEALANATHIDSAGPSLLFIELHPCKRGELPRKVTVLHKIHDVINTGLIHCLHFSPNGAILVAGCTDGSVQMYNAKEKYTPLGSFSAHALSFTPVMGIDFTVDSRYVRTFGATPSGMNKGVEVHLFDLFSEGGDGAAEVTVEAQLKILVNAVWASTSSVVAPEARAAMVFPTMEQLTGKSGTAATRAPTVSGLATFAYPSTGVSLLAASYSDGSVRVFG
jgi:WD40 repeat protein